MSRPIFLYLIVFHSLRNLYFAVDSLLHGVHSFIIIIIYDIPGKEISSLVNRDLYRGSYEVNWLAGEFPSGTYFYKLEAINIDKGKLQFSKTRRMILVK